MVPDRILVVFILINFFHVHANGAVTHVEDGFNLKDHIDCYCEDSTLIGLCRNGIGRNCSLLSTIKIYSGYRPTFTVNSSFISVSVPVLAVIWTGISAGNFSVATTPLSWQGCQLVRRQNFNVAVTQSKCLDRQEQTAHSYYAVWIRKVFYHGEPPSSILILTLDALKGNWISPAKKLKMLRVFSFPFSVKQGRVIRRINAQNSSWYTHCSPAFCSTPSLISCFV